MTRALQDAPDDHYALKHRRQAVDKDIVERLEPCPFCGGEDIRIRLPRSDYYGTSVYCADCSASTQRYTHTPAAIAVWNTRAEPTEILALRERLAEVEGRPEWRRPCDACGGEGKVEQAHMPLHHLHSEAPEYAVTDCGECDGEGWSWTDEPVTLAQCRPGPFSFNGSLGFKTEYGMTLPDGPTEIPGSQIRWKVTHWPDAYCMDSGEVFWGGTTNHEQRANLLVWPIENLIVGAQP